MKDDPIQRAIKRSPEYRQMMESMGERSVRAARNRAPRDDGTLQDSLGWDADEERLVVYSTVGYAANVDRGDAGRNPKPFLSGAAIDGMRAD